MSILILTFIAAPIVSYQVRRRFSAALPQHDDFGICMFCQMIEEELELNERIVLGTEHFVGMQLFASPTPFCTHIYPRRHMASFGDISGPGTRRSRLRSTNNSRQALLRTGGSRLQPDRAHCARGMCGSELFPLPCERHSATEARCRLRTRRRHVHQ